MLLALDIGNTSIHVGVFAEETLQGCFSLGADTARTADEYALLLHAMAEMHEISYREITQVILGSVLPSLTGILTAAVGKLTHAPVTVVGPGIKTGFPLRLDDPSELGADLAANTAGALRRFGAPVLIVDCGTATTVSAVDRDGAFVGCVIRPGVGMSLSALHNTGLLPDVIADAPLHSIGKNSTDSIRIGVVRGEALAIEGFLQADRNELQLSESTPVVLTGGYANLILPYLTTAAHLLPHLTLEGLCAIARTNSRRRR